MPQGLARALAAAEQACKSAKKKGRNRVELYACEDDSMMRRHDDVVAVGQLRAAFKNDRLLLYAQKIVPLQNPSLPGGYEILLRLRGPDDSIVAPGALINAAQRYQLLPTVDRWVVERALQMLTPYRSLLKSRGMSISINVSGQSIGDEDFIRRFTEQLKAANLPLGSITVEITEQAAVTNLARANDMIKKLKTMGCRLALDDFGTGANSLTNLKSLDIARVKIDGSFVRDIVTEQRSQVTVRAIVELAKGFAIDTVAEFVENKAIADAVRKLGVDYAQGYAFGKPEPLKEVLEKLSSEESRRLHKLYLEM
jgi:EAL domain-containing protein (putative c-di-GMP-specific phosphodiesterase class I)